MNESFENLCEKVKNLPYGRNANRHDFSLVVSEGQGTCSSKHAFLKQEALRMGVPNVELILGMYRMNNLNTPKIGNILIDKGLSCIPEAHCYLRIDGVPHDFTSSNADFSKLENDIMEEIVIMPEQVVEFKIEYHKNFLREWIEEEKINYSFEEIWQIREQCITNLANY